MGDRMSKERETQIRKNLYNDSKTEIDKEIRLDAEFEKDYPNHYYLNLSIHTSESLTETDCERMENIIKGYLCFGNTKVIIGDEGFEDFLPV